MSSAEKRGDAEPNSRKTPKTKKGSSLFKKPVDISKVNLPVIKVWLEETIHQHLPDDDIAVEFVFELLGSLELPDIDAIREQMNDFLGKDESKNFCEKLWKLLLSGQKDPDGIPEELLEQRKKQLEKETADQALQMIAQLRLKPDYNRSRPTYNSDHGRNSHNGDHRQKYNRDNLRYEGNRRQEENTDVKKDGKVHSTSPSGKTNYNRSLNQTSEGGRGSYNRKRKWEDEKKSEYSKAHFDARENDRYSHRTPSRE